MNSSRTDSATLARSERVGDARAEVGMVERNIPRAFVVLHIEEDGSYDLKVWGDDSVQVLWVDERCPGDRVFCHTHREPEAVDLKALIGDSPIGHGGDGKLDAGQVQAIRAMAWRMDGNRLAALSDTVPKEGG